MSINFVSIDPAVPHGRRPANRGQPPAAATGARLKELPPFGEPDAPYPPSANGAAGGAETGPGDDPLGLFLPPDPASAR